MKQQHLFQLRTQGGEVQNKFTIEGEGIEKSELRSGMRKTKVETVSWR